MSPFPIDPLASMRSGALGAKSIHEYTRRRCYDRLPCGVVGAFGWCEVLRDQGDRVGMRIAAKTAAFWLKDVRLAKRAARVTTEPKATKGVNVYFDGILTAEMFGPRGCIEAALWALNYGEIFDRNFEQRHQVEVYLCDGSSPSEQPEAAL